MVNPEFYSKQYAAIISAVDRAITFMENGHHDEAKILLATTLSAAEEAYIQASEDEPNP